MIVLFLLSGCAAEEEALPAVPTATLLPYATVTITPTREIIMPTVTAIPTIGPSPTPFFHLVQKNDTLLGIAIRYGVGLEELLAANPGIDRTIISVGQEIMIPGPEGDSASAFVPAPTALPLNLAPVTCYRTPADSLWCLTTVRNDGPSALEGISVMIILVDQNGAQVASLPAYGPINLLPTGQVLPLAANFPAPAPQYDLAIATPMSAFQAADVEARYLGVGIVDRSDEPGAERMDWRVTGRLRLEESESRETERVVLLAVALDRNGDAIGFRKWKAGENLAPGQTIPFELEIYSLGPAIEEVVLMVEAHGIEGEQE